MENRKRRKVDQHQAMNVVNYMVGVNEVVEESDHEAELEEIAQKFETLKRSAKKSAVLNEGDKCGICQTVPRDAKRHIQLHIRYGSMVMFSCELCGREYGLKSHLTRHMMTHSDKRPFPCSVCGKAFRSRAHLVIHERIHTGERPYKCDYCPKTFPCSSSYRSHLRVHTGEKPYACNSCHKRFLSKTALNQHMEKHGGSAVSCPVCGKVFETITYMTKHMKRMHSHPDASFLQAEDGTFMCENCDETFQNQEEIQKHIESHKFQACKFCKKLVLPETMEQHWFRMHQDKKEVEGITPKKVFNCEHCGKEYYARQSYANHLGKYRGKSKDKNMKCKRCQKEFPCKGKLREHKIDHLRALKELYRRQEHNTEVKLPGFFTFPTGDVYNPETKRHFTYSSGSNKVPTVQSSGVSNGAQKDSVQVIHVPLKRVHTSSENGVRVLKIPGPNTTVDDIKNAEEVGSSEKAPGTPAAELTSELEVTVHRSPELNHNDRDCVNIPTTQSEDTAETSQALSQTQSKTTPVTRPLSTLKVIKLTKARLDKLKKIAGSKKTNFSDIGQHRDVATKPEVLNSMMHLCLVCGKKYISNKFLEEHMAKYHIDPFVQFVCGSDGSYFCQKCKASFVTYGELEDHLPTHRLTTCNICSKDVLDEAAPDHLYRKHPERAQELGIRPNRNFTCKHCGKVYHVLSKLSVHVGLDKDSGFQCYLCLDQLPCKRLLKQHLSEHLMQNSA